MTAQLCILTPAPDDEAATGRWTEVFARMAAPLQALGAAVEPRPWVDAGDLSGFDLVLALMVWGKYRAVDRWLAAVAAWDAQGIRLHNPASVLTWANGDNSTKTFRVQITLDDVPRLASWSAGVRV